VSYLEAMKHIEIFPGRLGSNWTEGVRADLL